MLKRKPRLQHVLMTHCSFCLAIEGLSPQEISRKLKVPHDGGEVLDRQVADISFEADGIVSSWTLRSRVPLEAPPTEHLSQLVGRLEACRAELRALLDKGALAEIRLAMLGQGMFTAFELSPSLADRIAALNVPLWVYFTPEEEWDAAIAHVEPPH